MTTFTTDQWVILGLTFLLGLLVGMWLTAGGRHKWRTRYNEEAERRKVLERDLRDRETHWADREKDWRERETLSAAARRDGSREERIVERDVRYVERDSDRHPPERIVERGTSHVERDIEPGRPVVGRYPEGDRTL